MKGRTKNKPRLYSHIASAIIPSASIVAVPSAAQHFPQQKLRAHDQWGPLATTLLRASSTSQLLLPSSSNARSHRHEISHYTQRSASTGRINPSTDGEESDEEDQEGRYRQTKQTSAMKDAKSRSASLSDVEKRLFGHAVDDEESISTPNGTAYNSMPHLDSKQARTTELSQSIDNTAKRTSVTIAHQKSPPLTRNPLPSQTIPTSARSANDAEGFGEEYKSVTARSNTSNTTAMSTSARSVSFKDPVADEDQDSSSSKTSVLTAKATSVLDKLVIPVPEEYQDNLRDLENRNKHLNDEVQQLRLNNKSLHNQHREIEDRLQNSQKLSREEFTDLMRQSGRDQTKGLEDLNRTLQNRCDQLENDLSALRDRYNQGENQSTIRQLKKENHFLKDYVHRLSATVSDYQTANSSKAVEQGTSKEQRRKRGLPLKGPSPIWLLNQKYLAPLFVCYDEKIYQKDQFIKKLQSELTDIHDQVETITKENVLIHERLARSSTSLSADPHLSEIEQIKRQAYLVLEENKVLQDQLDLQSNRLTDVQKHQIHEVSNLTRRLLIVESEKSESDRILETIRIRNDDLKRKYEQLMLDNNHRIHIQEHVQEVSEMKRLTDELSQKHANELQVLLRRVQDAEAMKKVSQMKLMEYRSDVERLKGEIQVMKKTNKKLHLRVQTFENKLQLEQVKHERIATTFRTTNEELEQTKIERDDCLKFVKIKEEEISKIQNQWTDREEKISRLEQQIEDYRNKIKDRSMDGQDPVKKQTDQLKLHCLEYEQQIGHLRSLLNDKQILVDELYAEKRHLENDLESIWQATSADNLHVREQLLHIHQLR